MLLTQFRLRYFEVKFLNKEDKFHTETLQNNSDVCSKNKSYKIRKVIQKNRVNSYVETRRKKKF